MWSKSINLGESCGLSVAATEWSRRGLPCVLLHGLGDTACVWSDLAARLMPYFRTVAPDLRGHGDSDWDPEARYDSETFAADLAKVAAWFGFEGMILIGHSLGAAAIIRFAAANPGRVVALVIVDFGPELDAAGVDEVVRALAETPRSFASPDAYARWLIARRPFGNPSLLHQFARCNLRPSSLHGWELKMDAALAACSEISRLTRENGRYSFASLWPALAQIKCPSLVVRGMGSGVLPHEVAARMVEDGLPAGRLAIIGGAGHAVMLDNPGEFSGSVMGFLQGIGAPS